MLTWPHRRVQALDVAPGDILVEPDGSTLSVVEVRHTFDEVALYGYPVGAATTGRRQGRHYDHDAEVALRPTLVAIEILREQFTRALLRDDHWSSTPDGSIAVQTGSDVYYFGWTPDPLDPEVVEVDDDDPTPEPLVVESLGGTVPEEVVEVEPDDIEPDVEPEVEVIEEG